MEADNQPTMPTPWPHGAIGDRRPSSFKEGDFNRIRFNSPKSARTPLCNLTQTGLENRQQYLAQYQKSQDGTTWLRNTYQQAPPTPNTPPQPSDNPKRGQGKPRIELYKEAFKKRSIELCTDKKLGNGKYSTVYRAIDHKSKRQIAMKVIDTTELSNEVTKKFLPREIECWKQLHHKYIVTLHAQYESKSMIFLAMEYGNRGDLLAHVQTHGAISQDLAAVFMGQVLEALAYMHQNGIAHRDIKLENIVLFDTCVKLSDFGFVKKVEHPDALSMTYCGSKAYSAPELLRGQPYNPFISDIWSAGVVAFVMVTDSMPFNEQRSNEEIIEKQRFRRYNFPRHVALLHMCTSTIDCMLTFDPSLRPTALQCLQFDWIRTFYGK